MLHLYSHSLLFPITWIERPREHQWSHLNTRLISIAMITFLHTAREGSYTLSWPMDFEISICLGNHFVGRAYERGSLSCIGFWTGMHFLFIIIQKSVRDDIFNIIVETIFQFCRILLDLFLSWLLKFTYSGVTSDPINATMITNTIVVVLFSTMVCWSLSPSGFPFTMKAHDFESCYSHYMSCNNCEI